MKLIMLFLAFVVPMGMAAQTYEVSGTVKDREGQAVPFANVLLLQVADSTQAQGTSADELGFFSFPEVAPELYYLKASYFGYESEPVPLDIRDNIKIGAIFMEKDALWLDEVVVTAKQPTVERKSDRLVFNVENTVVAQGTTWDILRNTPGLINVDGTLKIKGQSATIYINDRKVQLTQAEIRDLLEGLSGNAISSVEVLPNPPAKYEAEGGPVVNIITNRNIVPGYKGSVQGTYEQAVYPKYSFGTSHFFKTDKLNLFANYVINPRKEYKRTDSHINFIDPQDDIFARWQTELDKTTTSQAQQASVILDYDLNDANRLNFTSSFSYSPNKDIENVVKTNMRNAQFVLDSSLTTVSGIDNDKLNIALDLGHELKLNKEGVILKTNVHYTHYDETQQQEGTSNYFDPAGAFIRDFNFSTDARQDINIFTGQLDYFSPLKGGSFEAGAKYATVGSRSNIDYFDVNGSQPPFDIALSNNFRYDETVFAGYASFLKNWGKWSIKLGLRGEQTDVKARSVTLSTSNDQHYFELFPTFYLLRTLGEDHSMSFDYSRKLRRPNYHDLNPFRYFLNENDYVEGNPELKPSFSHNLNLNYTYKDTYFFDIYYRDNGQFISTLSFQDNENQTLREASQNVLESTSYGLDFTVGKAINPVWYLYSYTSLFYEDETFLALESPEETAKNEVTGFYGYMGNYLTLTKDGSLTAEISLTYLTGYLDGSYTLSETTTLNAGLRKTLWKNRAVVSVAVEDILGKANARYTSRYLNQDNSYMPNSETRFVRFGLTLNFGNSGLTDNERNVNKSERDRLDN